jgi:transaldolase
MRPANLKTKIFLDSGDPLETRETLKLLGFLDGQTTNPTLVSKNPEAQKRLQEGKKFSSEEIYDFYKKVIAELSMLLPQGSISIEVYADLHTTSEQMFAQGKQMFGWIPNAHIKFPTTTSGLQCAENAISEGMRVNMTLCFSEEQAAAVYAATKGAVKGQVFVSPFVGRLDDIGQNGMDLIRNITGLYSKGDGHVELLAASVRSMEHFMYSLKLECDIITAPFKILREWAAKGMPMPEANFEYPSAQLKPIFPLELDLNQPWKSFKIGHDLTTKGIEKFAQDWNALVA